MRYMPGFVDRAIRSNLNRRGYVLMRSNRAALEMFRVPFTAVNAARFLYFKDLVDRTTGVEGDIVECGVGGAQSLLFLAILVKVGQDPRNLWGFDSFEGFPEPITADQSPRNVKAGQNAVSVKKVLRNINDYMDDMHFLKSRISLVKGFFQDTLTSYPHEHISLLHLDVDLYESYKVCLEELYPKLSIGGIVAFDEYVSEAHAWPGALKAIEEYFSGRNVEFLRDPKIGKYYVIKTEA